MAMMWTSVHLTILALMSMICVRFVLVLNCCPYVNDVNFSWFCLILTLMIIIWTLFLLMLSCCPCVNNGISVWRTSFIPRWFLSHPLTIADAYISLLITFYPKQSWSGMQYCSSSRMLNWDFLHMDRVSCAGEWLQGSKLWGL